MQKEIDFYQEMASEHRLQEYSKGTVPLYYTLNTYFEPLIIVYCIRQTKSESKIYIIAPIFINAFFS